MKIVQQLRKQLTVLSPDLKNLSRVSNRVLNFEILNFKWNQPYLSRVSNLSHGSNSLNLASVSLSRAHLPDILALFS